MRATAQTASARRDPELPSPPGEPPAETDAWWLSRAATATFTRRRLPLSAEHAAALRSLGAAAWSLVVEFNGAAFRGAALMQRDGRAELDLGDALAAEMAEILDDDDGLDLELVRGRGQPTLVIHPYVRCAG